MQRIILKRFSEFYGSLFGILIISTRRLSGWWQLSRLALIFSSVKTKSSVALPLFNRMFLLPAMSFRYLTRSPTVVVGLYLYMRLWVWYGVCKNIFISVSLALFRLRSFVSFLDKGAPMSRLCFMSLLSDALLYWVYGDWYILLLGYIKPIVHFECSMAILYFSDWLDVLAMFL